METKKQTWSSRNTLTWEYCQCNQICEAKMGRACDQNETAKKIFSLKRWRECEHKEDRERDGWTIWRKI